MTEKKRERIRKEKKKWRREATQQQKERYGRITESGQMNNKRLYVRDFKL